MTQPMQAGSLEAFLAGPAQVQDLKGSIYSNLEYIQPLEQSRCYEPPGGDE